MSLHAVADDVWPTTGEPRPNPYLETDGHWWSSLSKKRPLTLHSLSLSLSLSSIVSCNFRYIESAGNGFHLKMPRGGRDRSLPLFDLYTPLLSSLWRESFTSGGHRRPSSPLLCPIYSGQFSPNSSSISLRRSFVVRPSVRPPLINCWVC